MKRLAIILGMTCSLVSTAHAGVSAAVKSDFATWDTGTSLGGSASGTMLGVNAIYQNNDFFVGAGHSLGGFAISSKSVSIDRQESDISFGYQVYPGVFGFVAGKQISLDYTRNDSNPRKYSETISTYGLGGVTSFVVTEQLTGALAAAINVPSSSYQGSTLSTKGNGSGYSVEAALNYKLQASTNIKLATKYQSMILNYDNVSWTTSMVNLGLALSYGF